MRLHHWVESARGVEMNKLNKFIAVVMTVFLLAGIFGSYCYIVNNAHHNCIGDNCPICVHIVEAAQFISNIKSVPVVSFAMAVLCVLVCMKAVAFDGLSVCNTLISRKVELLN